jgi:tetratricopeptide (TPR) repeat protein
MLPFDENYYLLTIDAIPGWTPANVAQKEHDALASGDSTKAQLIKAEFLVSQGKTEEASKIYTHFMKIQPDNKEAVQGWLIANMERSPMGEKKALGQLEELGKQYPENTGILFYKFFIEAEHGMNEEALKDANVLIKLQPDSAVNYIGKGQVLYEMKMYGDAFQAFDKATSLQATRPDVWGMKAGALAKLGRYEEAIASCNKGIELAPSQASAIYNRGCIYCLKNDKANAMADLKRAIEMSPEFKEYAPKDKDFESLWKDDEFIALTK